MKLVQKSWRAMSDEQKEYYKEQSKLNRSQYEEKKRNFDEARSKDPDSQKLNVIEVIQERRVERATRKEQQTRMNAEREQREEEERRAAELKQKQRRAQIKA
jgi:hypothetical protein